MLLFMFTYSSAYIIDVDTNTFVLNKIIMVIFFYLFINGTIFEREYTN